ncbi:lebercilin-like protein isoform X2 [Lates japonicus]|uniref:Lebercilin-like protein n=1 Tax=Lates japonicus TaxID=270547 RepID=A0AAD3MNK2_LATJO|nr:lebercilin-like protein isoform X2 [Lates japonicus]
MSDRQQRLMQQALAHKRDSDCDAVSCSTDTSRWSVPFKLCPQYLPDCEDQGDSLADEASEAESSEKWQGLKSSGRKKGKKSQGAYKQKTNYAAHCHVLKLPQIKPLQVPKQRIQSANLNRIRDLKSQVWDLQQQLSDAHTENKLLKRLQHRHMVALQHFQDSEGSISQILTKHNNEARVLQGLLRDTRACRDQLARQLQATENKLRNTKATLQHLQLLSQDHSLLEREELTLTLATATAQLQEKDKRILDLEKNLELCQASFNRQLVAEKKKINEARKISCFLQEQIYQLTTEIQDRERERETRNIYSHRFLKASTKKVPEFLETENPVTEDPADVTSEEIQCCYNPVQESLETENTETEDPACVTSEENRHEDTEIYADTSEQNSCSEKSPEHQSERDSAEEKEASEVSQESDAPLVLEEQKTEEHEREVSHILEESLNTPEPVRKGYKLPNIKHSYTFKQTIENLHSGRPAYSSVDTCPWENSKSPTGVEALTGGI